MAFKLDKKKNVLLFTEADWLALLMNLFRAYSRKTGGLVEGYLESKKIFTDEMQSRAWFKKLNDRQQEIFIIKVMEEYAKGFKTNE